MNGKIPLTDFSNIAGYNPNVISSNSDIPSFIDTRPNFDTKINKIKKRNPIINSNDFLDYWCSKNLIVVHPWYECGQINEKIRLKLDKKYLYSVNLTSISKVRIIDPYYQILKISILSILYIN